MAASEYWNYSKKNPSNVKKPAIVLKLEACTFIRVRYHKTLQKLKSAILLKVRHFSGIFQEYLEAAVRRCSVKKVLF